MQQPLPLVVPDWPAPVNVQACVTTRKGGAGVVPYDSLNLGMHVGDDPETVQCNRARLRALLPAEPCWLEQVHGTEVVEPAGWQNGICGDAMISRERGVVCAVMTADCLPVLFCNDAGTVVGAAHAGWRGLVAGVLERTVMQMAEAPEHIIAWMGPAIGPQAFEVGDEVFQAFVSEQPEAAAGFTAKSPGKWMADLFVLARLRLMRAGVERIHGGGMCTFSDSERFYSYRRDRITGRFASLIWLA